ILLPPTAFAVTANCIQDVWQQHNNSQNLTCTAGDVRIADVTNISIASGGSCTGSGSNQTCSCAGATPAPTDCSTNPNQLGCVTFTADYHVVLNSQTRYDIGLYL